MRKRAEEYPDLHIYAQTGPHDDVSIVGTAEGLRRIRDAINRAIKHPDGIGYASPLFVCDGEGYAVHVRRVPKGNDLKDQRLPYTGPIYRQEAVDA